MINNSEGSGKLKDLRNGKMLQKIRNSTKNFDKDAVLLNVIKNEIYSVDIAEKLNNNPNSFLGTNMISVAINVDSNEN